MWGMPVATSYKGKSAIAETHPLSVGMVGTYGQDVANRVVGEADTVIVVGALLRSQETVRERPDIFDPRRQRVVQIDIDERNAGWSFPVEIGLVGDAGSILNQLVAASKEAAEASAAQRGEWTASVAPRKNAMAFYDDPEMHKDSSPVTPQRLVSILNEVSDPSTVYALDAGNNRTWMAHLVQGAGSGDVLLPRRNGGHGLGAAGGGGPEAGVS